ncbi:MAG TPA: PAS domain S-box protein, partial [Ignavibacteriaceae bacterium]|nr:PAS domain S-box protein [Ignavibacteriaceae bacterium]
MIVGKQNITKNKWQLFFAAIFAAIILSFGSYYYYLYEKDSMQRDKADYLKSISVLKINEITRWYLERLSEAEYFPANENFVLHTQKLLTESNNASAIEYFTKRLWPIKNRHGYENIFITSADNKILFSLNKDFNKIDSLTSNYIAETLNQKKIIFKDFYGCITHNSIHSDLISPIFDKNKNPIAVFVLRINPSDYLYPLIQNWPVPSKTAETLIFRIDGDSIVFLNSLRHTNHKPLSIKIPLTRKDMISVQGVLGKTGIIEGYDYRNTKVLGNVSPIPVLDWFMVTKIDESEVYADLRSKTTLIIFLSITSILLITSIIMLSYKNRQSKLYNEMFLKEKKLSETQEEFRTTLYSIGDGVITTDINGNVIRMNPVAETLTGWSESEAKNRRLNDIFKIISEKSGEVIENPADIVLRENIITELKNHTILISKNGKRTPIADTGSPIKNDEGKTIGVVLVFKDETEARLKKRNLLESEQKFSAIFHYSPVGIIITKTDGEIIDVNDIFLNTSGFTRSE